MANGKVIPPSGKCGGLSKSGKPCRAPAVRGEKYCSLHLHPNRAAELGRRGGQQNRILLLNPMENLDETAPRSARDVSSLVGRCLVATLAGQMSPRRATAVAYLASTMMRCLEQSAMEEQVLALRSDVNNLQEQLRELSEQPLPSVERRRILPTADEMDHFVEDNYAKQGIMKA